LPSIGQNVEIDPEKHLDYIYEPSEEILLQKLLPMYVHVLIFRALLETSAGENGARMAAMDNATSNCEEVISTLTLKMNKARQAAITAELMDIVGGTEALSKG
jgi:F-type H+-transporting ATPase subunit gamma